MNCLSFSAFAGSANIGKIERKTKIFLLTTPDFNMNENLKDQVFAGKAIALYNVYNVVDDNTEPTIAEDEEFTMKTSNAIKKVKADMHLSLCQQKQLNKIDVAKFSKLIEVTENNELLVVVDGGEYKGQDITSIIFSTRGRTTKEAASTTTVTITFADAGQLENEGGAYIPTFNFLKAIPRISVFGVDGNLSAIGTSSSIIVDRFCDCLTNTEFETLFAGLRVKHTDGNYENLANLVFTHTATQTTIAFDEETLIDSFHLANETAFNGVFYKLSTMTAQELSSHNNDHDVDGGHA